MSTELPLAVIGAGPKAAALAAKSCALRAEGLEAPPILVVERHRVAANWTGKHGYTSGSQRLGTPPEKDVGFPYALNLHTPKAIGRVLSDFSWISYLIHKKRELGDWIDRGRPHPTHKEWGKYIAWVLARSSAHVVVGDVERVAMKAYGWDLNVHVKGGHKKTFKACGLVVTGPGPSKRPSFQIPDHSRILFSDTFWQNLDILNHLEKDEDADPIVVVGGGETAASIVSYLVDSLEDNCAILVLTRRGTIFTRGEGYYENRMFTHDDGWADLPELIREEVINRSDRGVFSVDTIRRIALSRKVDHRPIEVTKIRVDDQARITINPGSAHEVPCQLLIFALPADNCWFARLLPEQLRNILNEPSTVARAIGRDLSVVHKELTSKLHLPMLAGLQQGPGYPNLSCLGTLSDRVLQPYLKSVPS